MEQYIVEVYAHENADKERAERELEQLLAELLGDESTEVEPCVA